MALMDEDSFDYGAWVDGKSIVFSLIVNICVLMKYLRVIFLAIKSPFLLYNYSISAHSYLVMQDLTSPA